MHKLIEVNFILAYDWTPSQHDGRNAALSLFSGAHP